MSRILSLLAALFSLVGCATAAVGSLFPLAPLTVLGGSLYLGVFRTGQRQAMTLMFLNLGDEAGRVALIFFGCFQLLQIIRFCAVDVWVGHGACRCAC